MISAYLISGLRVRLPAMVSIPLVKASGDLKSAKVYVSMIGCDDPEVHENCVDILNENAFEIQRHIAKNMQMKFCPKLRFYSDEKQQAALKVDDLIRKTFDDDGDPS